MKRITIFTIYLLIFWICLPTILIYSAISLENSNGLERFDSNGLKAAGAVIILIAVPMLAVSIIQFKKFGKKYPISATPPATIIQKGLFAVWRHPIYLFYTMVFIAIALLWGSTALLFIVLPIFVLLEALYIFFEEKILLKRFGATYKYYKRRTRLIIPKSNDIQALFFKLVFKALFAYEVINKDRIPDRGPYFVVAAHRNYLDPFFIGCAIPHLIRFITTFEMFRNPKISWYFRLTKCIPKKRYMNDINTGRQLIRALQEEDVVGVFPEGERSWAGTEQEIKHETLNLFYKFHHIPILPIKLKGNFHAWPRWGKRMGRAKLRVEIQDPIHVDRKWKKEAFEARLRQAIDPKDLDDSEFYCRSRNKTNDIAIVLYRCPTCLKFETIKIVNDNECHCSNCNNKIEVDEKFQLHIHTKEGKRKAPLDAVYQQIRITQSDIVKCTPGSYPGLLEKVLSENEFIIAYARVGTLFRESTSGMETLTSGTMVLTNFRIHFISSEGKVGIPLEDISSVTIEGYKKIHLYDFRQQRLYQMIIENESALKWQDFLVMTIQKLYNRIPNTR